MNDKEKEKKEDASTTLPTLEEVPYEGKKKKYKKKHHSPKRDDKDKSEKVKFKKIKKETIWTETSSESSRNHRSPHRHKRTPHDSPIRKEKTEHFHFEEVPIFVNTLNPKQKLPVIIPVCSRRATTSQDVATNKTKYSPSTSHYITEVSTQHPVPVLNPCLEMGTLKDAGDQTITNNNIQQTQVPSETKYLTNQCMDENLKCKYAIDPYHLMKKLETLDQRKCPRNTLEVNNSSPFIHVPCQPCIEERNKVEERFQETKVIQSSFSQQQQIYSEESKEQVDYQIVFEPFDCSAFNKPIVKGSTPVNIPSPKMISEITTCHFSKTTQPCQTSLQTNLIHKSQNQQTQIFQQPIQQSQIQQCDQLLQSQIHQKEQHQFQKNLIHQSQVFQPCAPCSLFNSHHHHYQSGHGFPSYIHETCISQPKFERKLIRCEEGEGLPCPGLRTSYDSGLDKKPIMIKLLPRKETYCCWGRRSSWEQNPKDQRPEGILGLTEVTNGTKIWKMLFAEFLGTFLLVLIGCGAILAIDGTPTIIEISMAFGLTIGSVVQIIGHVSGGHINPAVTISFFVACEMKLLRTLLYIVAQLLGAAAGAALLMVATPDHLEGQLGVTDVAQVNVEQAFLYEVLLTFFFVLVIHTVADSQRKDIRSAPAIIIGLAAAACHLSGIKFSGSSMNPARSFGPALVINHWTNHWIYWAGPIIGACIAALLYKFFLKPKKSDDESYDF